MQKNNTSGFRGVNWQKSNNRWRARIYYRGKIIVIGSFTNKIEAAYAYVKEAKKLLGEYTSAQQLLEESLKN